MYRIIIEDKALKGLSKIPKPHNSRIVKAIDALAKEPYPAGCKKLKSRNKKILNRFRAVFLFLLKTFSKTKRQIFPPLLVITPTTLLKTLFLLNNLLLQLLQLLQY